MTIRDMITAERRELAAELAALPDERWDEPTLCEGWRVRELVAHMVMPYRYSTGQWILEMLKSAGRPNHMADRCARSDASSVSAKELAKTLGDNADNPWKPPGGGYEGALTHDVVHGLDFSIPLGLDRKVPEDRLRLVLKGLIKPRGLRYFGVDVDGVLLQADDMEWTFGSGTPLTGAAQDLAMVLCGRRLPPGHLEGEPAARFTTATSSSAA